MPQLFCGCESLYCDHNANGIQYSEANPPSKDAMEWPRTLRCTRIPTGQTLMAFIGDVCEICAANMERTHPEWITRR